MSFIGDVHSALLFRMERGVERRVETVSRVLLLRSAVPRVQTKKTRPKGWAL